MTTTTSQPKPLRVIAAAASTIPLIVGLLPALGVDLTAEVIGAITALVAILANAAVALIGETTVTPLTSPHDADGNPLTPD